LPLGLALIGCYSETSSRAFARNGGICTLETSDVFLEAVASSASFDVDSSARGSTTGLRVVFHLPQGVREVHEAVFVAPAAFGFLGFDALGPARISPRRPGRPRHG